MLMGDASHAGGLEGIARDWLYHMHSYDSNFRPIRDLI